MQIYISWSGQSSYKVALALRDLIFTILPGIDVWMSAEDIKDGARWSPELARILDQSVMKILCVDPPNQSSSWLIFEAGAIAKSTDKWNIKIFLFELKLEELRGPLSQYQTVLLDESDVRRMFEDIHAIIDGVKISKQEMVENLGYEWPDFKKTVQNITLESGIPSIQAKETGTERDEVTTLEYIDEVDEKILTLLFINEGIEEEKIATTVYLGRGECLRHLIDLEGKELVRSTLSYGIRRWYITDKGKKYLPGVYQGYESEIS